MTFPETTCKYLVDLADNNNKEWFDANRERYETEWLEPAANFIESFGSALHQIAPNYVAKPKINGSIRRIHRDTRFAKDKAPYNPRLHLIFWQGAHPNKSPGIHFVLYPTHLVIGAGQWQMNPNELALYRQALLQDAERLQSKIDECAKLGYALTEPTVKRSPIELPLAQQALARRKGW